MFRFNRTYFILALILFIIEALIAAFVRDSFVRPYVGDFLVVIFLYCLCMAFVEVSYRTVILGVVALAYLIELGQYFHLIHRLGLQKQVWAHMVLGSGFDWKDLIAYTLGGLVLLIVEQMRERSSTAG